MNFQLVIFPSAPAMNAVALEGLIAYRSDVKQLFFRDDKAWRILRVGSKTHFNSLQRPWKFFTNDKLYLSTVNDKLYLSTVNDKLYLSTVNDKLYLSTVNDKYLSTVNDKYLSKVNDKLYLSTVNDKLCLSTGLIY